MLALRSGLFPSTCRQLPVIITVTCDLSDIWMRGNSYHALIKIVFLGVVVHCLEQEDQELEASLGHIARSYPKGERKGAGLPLIAAVDVLGSLLIAVRGHCCHRAQQGPSKYLSRIFQGCSLPVFFVSESKWLWPLILTQTRPSSGLPRR